MKLLLDMNLAPRWTQYLGAAGICARHWSDIGPSDATDAAIMAYARTEDFIIFTQDLDFTTLLAFTRDKKPSVIQLRAENTSPEIAGPHVVHVLQQYAQELDDGALLTIDIHRARLRLLPL